MSGSGYIIACEWCSWAQSVSNPRDSARRACAIIASKRGSDWTGPKPNLTRVAQQNATEQNGKPGSSPGRPPSTPTDSSTLLIPGTARGRGLRHTAGPHSFSASDPAGEPSCPRNEAGATVATDDFDV